jgi:hypothetical protein
VRRLPRLAAWHAFPPEGARSAADVIRRDQRNEFKGSRPFLDKRKDDEMSNKLKDCPHCDKNTVRLDCAVIQDTELEHFVICSNCGCVGPNDTTRERAIVMWNLRRREDAQAAQIKELVAAGKRTAEMMNGWLEIMPPVWKQVVSNRRDELLAAIAKCEETK